MYDVERMAEATSPELVYPPVTESQEVPEFPTPDVSDEVPVRIRLPEDELPSEEYRRELLERAKGAERTPERDAALAELLEMYTPLLKHSLGGYGKSLAQIEDLVQEAVVRTWRFFSNFQGSLDKLGGYVVATAQRCAIDEHRRMSARPFEVALELDGKLSDEADGTASRDMPEFTERVGDRHVVEGILAFLDEKAPNPWVGKIITHQLSQVENPAFDGTVGNSKYSSALDRLMAL